MLYILRIKVTIQFTIITMMVFYVSWKSFFDWIKFSQSKKKQSQRFENVPGKVLVLKRDLKRQPKQNITTAKIGLF